jgi:hypothetical protein
MPSVGLAVDSAVTGKPHPANLLFRRYFDAEACARSALGSHWRSTGSIAVYWHGNEDEAPTRIEENQVQPRVTPALPMQHEAQPIDRDRDDDLLEDGP